MPTLNLEHSLVDDRYEVLARLNLGSYAEIYTARDRLRDGRLVILKALNTALQGEIDDDLARTLVENFENEAKALDKVRHPNIVRRLGHGTAVDLSGTVFHYLIFEYLPGGDLRERCHNNPFSLDELLYYLNQVCSALAHAHECGVIHRDIKPHNLLLTADRKTVKIADFGVAKIAPQANEEITRVGTDVYAPPEHHPLNSDVIVGAMLTPSADIYSLAKTVYTLLCGTSPRRFSLKPITELPPQMMGKPWSEGLLAILKRATSAEVDLRYQSVRDFYADLESLADTVDGDETRVRPRHDPGSLPPAPPRPDFAKSDALNPKIVVSVPHISAHNAAAIKTDVVGPPPTTPERKDRFEVSIQQRTQKPIQNGTGPNVQTPVRKPKKPQSLNRWQRADIFLSRHRKIILVLISLGILVALLAIVYNSFKGATIEMFGHSLGSGVNAIVDRDVSVREGPNGTMNGYVKKGARLHVIRAVGDNSGDWSKSWLEVDVVDWNNPDPTGPPHGYIYGSFVDTNYWHLW